MGILANKFKSTELIFVKLFFDICIQRKIKKKKEEREKQG